LLRSKARWFEEGDRPTGFFFGLEHERIQRIFISSVLNSDDVEVFSSDEIEREHVCFYSDLFSSEPVHACCKQACLTSIEKHISFSQQPSCEGFLWLQELTESVKGLNFGKSPGSDGLSVEFYLHFWEILGPLLLPVANVFGIEICDSMKGSVTRVIF